MSIALPLMRRRGPGISPRSIASRTAVSARAGAFGAHVALGGEAGEQIVARGERRADGAFGNRFVERLRVLGARMQEQMHVRVDETGHQRAVAEVDRFRVGRMIDVPTRQRRCVRRAPALQPGETIFPVSISSSRAACSTVSRASACEHATARISARNATHREFLPAPRIRDAMRAVSAGGRNRRCRPAAPHRAAPANAATLAAARVRSCSMVSISRALTDGLILRKRGQPFQCAAASSRSAASAACLDRDGRRGRARVLRSA